MWRIISPVLPSWEPVSRAAEVHLRKGGVRDEGTNAVVLVIGFGIGGVLYAALLSAMSRRVPGDSCEVSIVVDVDVGDVLAG